MSCVLVGGATLPATEVALSLFCNHWPLRIAEINLHTVSYWGSSLLSLELTLTKRYALLNLLNCRTLEFKLVFAEERCLACVSSTNQCCRYPAAVFCSLLRQGGGVGTRGSKPWCIWESCWLRPCGSVGWRTSWALWPWYFKEDQGLFVALKTFWSL